MKRFLVIASIFLFSAACQNQPPVGSEQNPPISVSPAPTPPGGTEPTTNPANPPPANLGQQVILTGSIVCLKHKNVKPGDPETMECALGFKEDGTGKYYGLKNFVALMFETSAKVKVTGTLEAAISDKYEMAAVINVTKMEKL